MNLFLRQIWALMRKNLLLICIRRPFYTFFRAIALPLVVILVVAYSKNFFSSPEHWGLSSPHSVSRHSPSPRRVKMLVQIPMLTLPDTIAQRWTRSKPR